VFRGRVIAVTAARGLDDRRGEAPYRFEEPNYSVLVPKYGSTTVMYKSC
jgi:hypothetical protein